MIREYKSIKCVEFSNFYPIIMNPGKINEKFKTTEEPGKQYVEFLKN
jgi:hypothetical protein